MISRNQTAGRTRNETQKRKEREMLTKISNQIGTQYILSAFVQKQ